MGEITMNTETFKKQAEESRKNWIKSKGIAYQMYLTAKNAQQNVDAMTTEQKYNIILEEIKKRAEKGYLCYFPDNLPVGVYSYYNCELNDMLRENGFSVVKNDYDRTIKIAWEFLFG